MRRPKHPMPQALWDLRNNPKTGLYEITEDGIKYSLELEQVRKLREYFKNLYFLQFLIYYFFCYS